MARGKTGTSYVQSASTALNVDRESFLGHYLGHETDAKWLTRERIRQIEAKALRKLKHPSRSRLLRSFLDT